jgi:RNA polymerase sigma-70 factor (ECF subfamily)
MPFTTTLAAARSGSGPALGTILESCRGYIAAVAVRQVPRKLRGRVHPSSLVQETYLRACRNFGQFRGQSECQLLAWLRQIMLHSLMNLLRQAEFRAPVQALPADLIGAAAAPVERTAAKEFATALARSLERLPAHYRLAIELRHFERMSFEDIGHVLGCSAEAARKVWARAQAKLGEELQAFQ